MGCVLLVEDEGEICELIEDALKDAGVEVRSAATDSQAYCLLAMEPRSFEVLVADVNLGLGTTGFDVSRKARQLNPDLKVIYITGDSAHLGRFGVDGAEMFPKPFNARELAEKVKAKLS